MGRKEEEFELFWSLLLGRKVDKKKARMEFVKIKTNLSVQELASRFNSLYRATSEERFVPHPQRWLKNERWSDEVSEKVNGEEVYRDGKGFIVSKKEWEKKR